MNNRYLHSSVVFSDDRRYRYSLVRAWDTNKPKVSFCLLNPSTADETHDDATISRCIERARRLGYGSIEIVNLFAFKSTQPKYLYAARYPKGTRNFEYIIKAAKTAQLFIVGWGQHGRLHEQDKFILQKLKRTRVVVYCLGQNKNGTPRHPLYLSYNEPIQLLK